MITAFDDALQWIHNRLSLGIKPGLQRMEWMMEKLDYPERRLKAIHIGGTNGKGSTVAFIRSILQETGYEVGTFTSPYIEQFNERISVNGQAISDEEIVELVNIVKPLADQLEQTDLGAPTEFEVITAMAMLYFAKIHPVDVVLFEVGLGGRLDSTNIIHPILAVITSIGLDHTHILGETIEEIAFEKAGIIKGGVPVVSAVEQQEAKQVIEKRAKEGRSSLYDLGKHFTYEHTRSLPEGEEIEFQSVYGDFKGLTIGLRGNHQVSNASTAIMACLYLKKMYAFLIEEEHIRKGVQNTQWPARMEFISDRPPILLDGAHNYEGIQSLVQSIKTRFPNKKATILFAGLKDKKLDKMIPLLDEIAEEIIFTTFDFPRAAKEEDFAVFIGDHRKFIADWNTYIEERKQQTGETDLLLITGSLYFISAIKKCFNN
ncbi:dihydrofolate synthase/folylpolyglutamate synthase [Oikeobacillus pervagus]|uniref:Dihydrofolate synthase/folylpolyglutamate synthase n=1 Tax=Oikeobacillus pervagus TaxID=1325931 RepID=A0AAJ1WKH7_9BACI|nr:folylpolyglutamate synthase/dihydrofolate synthase family protein [Oikeobacillus pervagus]MDQ0216750.1 dihydrofolate synthase/folylpolyglutamate synthase [Oikeobacillus pervagus]